MDKTTDDAFKGTVRFMAGGANVNAYYLHASRDYEGHYEVGLETSGVRAYDVWTRDRDQVGVIVDLPLSDELSLNFGGSYWKDEYPGAVEGFTYGYGLQDSKSGSALRRAHLGEGRVARRRLGRLRPVRVEQLPGHQDRPDAATTTRPTAGTAAPRTTSSGSAPKPWRRSPRTSSCAATSTTRSSSGDWTTENLATPDINSAVAYPFPELSDSTLSFRASLVWAVDPEGQRRGPLLVRAVPPRRLHLGRHAALHAGRLQGDPRARRATSAT